MAAQVLEERRFAAPLTHLSTTTARAAAVALRLNRAHAELVQLCAEVLADGSWAEPGIRSTEHWLVLRAGLTQPQARDVVLVARRRTELPALSERVDDGRLSLGQAAAVARYVPASHQRSVAELAEHTTAPQLGRLLARYTFDTSRADETAPDERRDRDAAVERAQAPCRLSMHHDEHGRFRLVLDAPADQGALVQQAVREAKDALFSAGNTEATPGDALVEVASRSLAAVRSPSRSEHYRVYVHLAADATGGWVNGGGAITPGLAALFTCDGLVNPVIERDARPVSVGRTMRIVPARTRRLIEDRDRGCTFPGCASTSFVEIHHVVPWAAGGRTDFETNIALCPRHHRDVHTGDVVVDGAPTAPPGTAGALRFTNRHGLPLGPAAPAGTGVGTRRESTVDEPAGSWVAPTGERFDHGWVDLPCDAAMAADDELRRAPPWLRQDSAPRSSTQDVSRPQTGMGVVGAP